KYPVELTLRRVDPGCTDVVHSELRCPVASDATAVRIPRKSCGGRCCQPPALLGERRKRRRTRSGSDGPGNSGGEQQGKTPGRRSRPVGKRQSRLIPIVQCALQWQNPNVAARLLVAGAHMGQKRRGIRMERTGVLEHGPPGRPPMEGAMDVRRLAR